jgi:hypothetical protein
MITATTPLNQIWQTGLEALLERLGPVGMIRFLQQFETGQGDYTAERESWLTETDLDALVSKSTSGVKPKKAMMTRQIPPA